MNMRVLKYAVAAITVMLFFLFSCNLREASNTFYDLQVQDIENPQGIQDTIVKFAWKYKSNGMLQQTHCEIEVAKDEGFTDVIFSSKLMENSKCFKYFDLGILESNQKYYWHVRIKDDKESESGWSKTSSFITGIVHKNEWKAKLVGESDITMTRCEFNISKKVKSVIANVTSGGLYEFHLNGQKVGDRVLEPVQTATDKRLVYATYDVTDLIKNGENAAAFYLSNGAFTHLYQAVNRNVLLQMNIFYSDGTKDTFITDKNWKARKGGPILFSALYSGEYYDARKELSGWSKPEFDDQDWINVKEYEHTLLYPQLQPIKEKGVVPYHSLKSINDSVMLYDMGKNITGYPSIKVIGEVGSKVNIRVSEILNDDGTINYWTTGGEWKLEYTLKGAIEEEWQPKFTNCSFRYIEITTEGKVSIEDVKGIHIYSDLKTVGSFACSDSLIDKIQNAYLLSQEGNLMGYPTDCPHRERLGWLGDALQIGVSSSYNYDMQYFWKKWFRDMNDDQLPDGNVHMLIPFPYETDKQDPVWQSASIIMPWEIYVFYGDDKILKDSYHRMRRLMEYYKSKFEDNVISFNRWGDWVQPYPETKNTGAYLSTAYYYRCATIMHDVANVLNNKADADKYKLLAKNIKRAINKSWYNKDGYYDFNTQTSNALALDFGFVDQNNEKDVFEQLVKKLKEANNHIGTGVVGQMPLLSILDKKGRDDIISEMLMHKDYPGLGMMIEKGATTLWEKYHYGTGRMDSHNHVFLGGPHAKWFYDGLAGISPLEPGFKKIKIAPAILEDEVKASFNSPYGTIKCAWTRDKQAISLSATIPFNTTALLHLPTDIFDLNLVNIKQNNEVIWSGKTDKSGDDIKFKTIENGKVVYELQPGSYVFELYK
ncbi:MAG: glycoside hydrolase family 78 protein [Carboxylicivirga sp.]|jgi:alpha-L-rhamnosidase|nr:glycoside hydrolase family 78 protein [Carboxylicivirga sp.]